MRQQILVSLCDEVLQGALALEDAIAEIRQFGPFNLLDDELPGDLRKLLGVSEPPQLNVWPKVFAPAEFEEIEKRYNSFVQAGQFKLARVVAELGLAAARTLPEPQHEAYFGYLLAGVLGSIFSADRRNGLREGIRDVPRRVELCRMAVDVFQKQPTQKSLLGMAILRLGNALCDARRWDEAALWGQRAISTFEEINDTSNMARAWNNVGYSLLMEGKHSIEMAREQLIVSRHPDSGEIEAAVVQGGSEAASRALVDTPEERMELLKKYERDLRSRPKFEKPVSVETRFLPSDIERTLLLELVALLRRAVDALTRARTLHAKLDNSDESRNSEANLSLAAAYLADVLLLHAQSFGRSTWEEIAHLYELALLSPDALPNPHAIACIHSGLGRAYAQFEGGVMGENLARSVRHFENALRAGGTPELCVELGDVRFRQRNWQAAYDAYTRAEERSQVETWDLQKRNEESSIGMAMRSVARNWAGSMGSPEGPANVAANAPSFYAQFSETCHRLRKSDQAFLCAAKAKARLLARQLELAEIGSCNNVPTKAIRELSRVRDEIRKISWFETSTDLRTEAATWVARDDRLHELHGEEGKLLEEIAQYDLEFAAAIGGEIADWAKIRNVLAENEILLEFIVNKDSTLVFIGTAQMRERPDVLLLEDFGDSDLAALVVGVDDGSSCQGRGFLRAYWEGDRREWLSELRDALDGVQRTLFERASQDSRSLQDALARTRAQIAPASTDVRLTIVPHGYLHYLPLHACPIGGSASNTCLLDEYIVSYAPSTSVLYRIRRRERAFTSLCAYADPDGTLPATRIEVDCISKHFADSRRSVLPYGRVAKTELLRALRKTSVFHAAGHAKHEFADFRMSYLQLSDTLLPLKEVLATVETPELALVVLSACETGLASPRSPDELLNFAGAFLQTGAKWVVATLWQVDDLATCLLMVKMYELLFHSSTCRVPLDPPTALTYAQRWLKQRTLTEGIDYLRSLGVAVNSIEPLLRRALGASPHISDCPAEAVDFANVASWAGVFCSGA